MNKFFRYASISLKCLFALAMLPLYSEEVVVLTPDGDSLTVEIAPEDTFQEAIQKIEGSFDNSEIYASNSETKPFIISYMVAAQMNSAGAVNSSSIDYRVYNRAVTSAEKADLRYILTTLASDSWASIIGSKSSLNKAGDRIDHVHPFRFLETIFNDKELRGAVHSVRDRKLIWKNFYDGLEESLQEESNKGNIQKFVQDFAKSVGINTNLISGQIANQDWSGLMNTLLTNLPRSGNTTRYDM